MHSPWHVYFINMTSISDCYVLANTALFTAAKKAYIDENLFDETAVENYIKEISGVTASWDASKVLRFGECGNDSELLIPSAMLGAPKPGEGAGGPLGLEVHCYSSIANMKAAMNKAGYGMAPPVDYAAFQMVRKAAPKLKARIGEPATCGMQ